MVRVDIIGSSVVDSVGYDEASRILEVGLPAGWYYYHDVPKRIFDWFVEASSAGSFYNTYVKGQYDIDGPWAVPQH